MKSSRTLASKPLLRANDWMEITLHWRQSLYPLPLFERNNIPTKSELDWILFFFTVFHFEECPFQSKSTDAIQRGIPRMLLIEGSDSPAKDSVYGQCL